MKSTQTQLVELINHINHQISNESSDVNIALKEFDEKNKDKFLNATGCFSLSPTENFKMNLRMLYRELNSYINSVNDMKDNYIKLLEYKIQNENENY